MITLSFKGFHSLSKDTDCHWQVLDKMLVAKVDDKFEAQDTHGENRESSPESCSPASTYTHVDTHTEGESKQM